MDDEGAMDIPFVPVTYRDETVFAAEGSFDGRLRFQAGDTVPLREVAPLLSSDVRGKVLICDTDSINARGFDSDVMKHCRVKGSDTWLMTFIGDADDLFDAFNYTAERVLAPLNFISPSDLTDIASISEGFIPVIPVVRGRFTGNSYPKDPCKILEELSESGLYQVALLDLDNSLGRDQWEAMVEEHPATIPMFNRYGVSEEHAQASVRIVPLRLGRYGHR